MADLTTLGTIDINATNSVFPGPTATAQLFNNWMQYWPLQQQQQQAEQMNAAGPPTNMNANIHQNIHNAAGQQGMDPPTGFGLGLSGNWSEKYINEVSMWTIDNNFKL